MITPGSPDWLLIVSLVVPMVMAAIAGAISFIDAADAPAHKRPIRLFESACCWYFVVIYATSAYAGMDIYFIRAGYATRLGVLLVLLMLIVDIIASRRGGRK